MPFRPRLAFALLLATTLLGHASILRAQDFDPAGRRRRPPSPSPSPRPSPRPPPIQRPNPGPSSEALITRYTAIVLAQPGSPFPLERLAQLYRERDGHLKQLVLDLEVRASGPDAFGAKLALAHAYRLDGRIDDSLRAYEALIQQRPNHPAPLLALARLHRDRGDLQGARARYEQSLPLLPRAEREPTLHTLRTLALDLGDFEAAKGFHQQLVREAHGSSFVRGELARELMARGEYARAEIELRALVTAASGDNRALAPALRDLGRALASQEKHAEALAVLNRALTIAGPTSGISREIFTLVVEVHRKQGDIAGLIAKIETARPNDTHRLTILGELYEETGRVDDALFTYEKAVRLNPKSIESRLKIIHLLHAKGELVRATHEYEALLRIAPHNPDYVFELCDTLIQRGERERALKRLSELERRLSGDEEMLQRLVDLYERIDEKPRALALLQKLAARSSRDPSHLVELGDRYWQEGDKKRALETWARIRTMIPNRAKALATLGEVYLDHDMPKEALEALRSAAELEPSNVGYQKAYAMALERARATDDTGIARQHGEQALEIWQRLLENAGSDRNLAREARTHIVTLLSVSKKLDAEIPKLEKRFADTPPDLEAGRLLAEAWIRLRKLPQAERTLRLLSELAPGDADAFLTLERVLVLRRDLGAAIEILTKLVEIDPRRAREFYRRMAEYAAELYRDEDALRYAERAVALSPDDAEGHRKLGEMYRKRQEPELAIQAYRAAIAKNDLAFPVYFELADLLLAKGEAEEADRLYRRVLRACPDEELVARAARQSIQLNLARGTLASLEQELLPIVLGNPRKLLHRRLLVELYGDMAYPLVRLLRHGSDEERQSARKQLVELGARAVKPLLDALGDEREGQPRIAIDVLAFVSNKAAGPALFAFATGQADLALREQAMLACGSLRDPALLPRYEELLVPKDAVLLPGDPVSMAAAWGVAGLHQEKARALLSTLLKRGTPELRALAALGFASQGERRAIPELLRVARAADAGALARAAAALALGELGAKEATLTLFAMAYGEERLMRQASMRALARLGAEQAKAAVAEGLTSSDARLRAAALDAARLLVDPSMTQASAWQTMPEGRLDVAAMLMPPAPGEPSPEEAARALVFLGPALRSAAAGAAMISADRASILADALLSRDGEPAFGALTNRLDEVDDPGLREEAERAAASIAEAVVPAFVALHRHPSVEVRIRAASFLATRKEDAARAAVLDALADPEEPVVLATLAALGPASGTEIMQRVTELLASSPSWSTRSRAARALGRLGAGADSAPSRKLALAMLDEAARGDAYALVREEALRALFAIDRDTARAALLHAADDDEEPAVRELARELLEKRMP